MVKTEFLAEFGKAFIPKRIRPGLKYYLMKAGIDHVPYKFFGALFTAEIIVTALLYIGWFYKEYLIGKHIVVIGLLTFLFFVIVALLLSAMIILLLHFQLNIRIYKRTKLLEEKLADYLVLVSTNLKGGLSFEKSLWLSIKPEFGILAKEITLVSKKVMTGNDLSDALIEFSKKYDSPILRRTIPLIIGELETGGKIVDIIDNIIANLRKARILKEEMAASTVTFMIFIGAIVIVISPLLFALSFQLMNIIIGFSSKIGAAFTTTGAPVGAPLNFTQISISPSDFKIFSVLAISIIAFFSSMIISTIEKGNIKGGLKYIPSFILTALFFYFLFLTILGSLFQSAIV
jgi:pilus assembly protein TadC